MATENTIGSAEDRTCPECGKEGEFLGVLTRSLREAGPYLENTPDALHVLPSGTDPPRI